MPVMTCSRAPANTRTSRTMADSSPPRTAAATTHPTANVRPDRPGSSNRGGTSSRGSGWIAAGVGGAVVMVLLVARLALLASAALSMEPDSGGDLDDEDAGEQEVHGGAERRPPAGVGDELTPL